MSFEKIIDFNLSQLGDHSLAKNGFEERIQDCLIKKVHLDDKNQVETYGQNESGFLESKVMVIIMNQQEQSVSTKEIIKTNNYLCDMNYTLKYCSDELFYTPIIGNTRQRIQYKVEELTLEDQDVSVETFKQLANLIGREYQNYNGFVLVVPSISIVYLGSQLSFMLENLAKPVIMTSSQFAFSQMRNDAFQNIVNCLVVAGQYLVPEVVIVMNNRMYRANRCVYYDARTFDIVHSIDNRFLGTLKTKIDITWKKVKNDNSGGQFTVQSDLDQNIGILRISPYLTTEIVESVLLNNSYKAIIIQSFSRGVIPLHTYGLEQAITKAIAANRIVVNVSQNFKDSIDQTSQNIQKQQQIGVILTADITLISCQAKLSYLLAKYNLNPQKDDHSISAKKKNWIEQKMKQNLRLEMSEDCGSQQFAQNQESLIQGIKNSFKYKSPQNTQLLRKVVIPNILCHLSEKGLLSTLEQLIDKDSDINQGDYEQRTPLNVAVRNQQLQVVEYLLSFNDINVNKLDRHGRSPLYYAVLLKNKHLIYILLQNKAKVIVRKDQLTNTILNAAQQGDLELIKMLFYAGVKNLADYKNSEGRNIGHIAVSHQQVEIVEFLCNQVYLSFDLRDKHGKTGLNECENEVIMKIIKQ